MSDSLRLEHGIRAPGQARRWLVQRCRKWDCDALADSAALITTELVTNVFLHARTDCLIHAAFVHPTLTVTVTDQDNRELSVQPPSDTAEDGRGLAIVAGVADAWGVKQADGAKTVWFHLSNANQPHA
jgi:anti-sigma regulatory factor (Ser/Thr protein kinase)